MAGDVIIIPATMDHLPVIARNMREADVREVKASHGHSPIESLREAVITSRLAWVAVDDDGPILIWGVASTSFLSDVGSPWMLGTDRISEVWREFSRRSKEYVHYMKMPFDRLENYVDARNKISIRWLKWCGFTIHPAKPYGVEGLPFHRFTMGG